MDNEVVEDAQSPSTNGPSRPSKRQKFNTSDPSNSNISDNERMKKEFEEFRSQLNRTETVVIQYHKIREQTEELSRKERNLLEMQLQSDEKELSKLQEDLTSSMRDGEETRRAEESAKVKLSQLKIVMVRKITPLLMSLNTEGSPLASLVQEISVEAQDRSKPVGEIIEVEKTMNNHSISTKESNPESIQIKEAKRQLKALKTKGNCAEKLEEELRIAGDTISSLHEALKKQESSIKEKLDEVEKLQQEVNMLQNNSSLLAKDNIEASSDQPHDDSGAESEAFGIDQESATTEDGEQQENDDSKLLRRRKCPFLALYPKFVEIDWDEEFIRKDKVTWVCKTCSNELPAKGRMEDHVWTVHYGGKFQCPLCTDPPTFSSRRTTIMNHMRRKRHT